MASLPDNWESDYDGNRWFFRFKPTGLIQYTFPKPGDEYPEHVDVFSPPPVLSPEERLASQYQVKRRNTAGGGNGSSSQTSRPKDGLTSATVFGSANDDPNFWQLDGLMYMGPGGYTDISPEDDDEGDPSALNTKDDKADAWVDPSPPMESSQQLERPKISPMISAETTPLPTNTRPATSTPPTNTVITVETQDIVQVEAGPPESPEVPLLDGRQITSPVGYMPELASELTAQCREETHPPPVELPTYDMTYQIAAQPVMYANAFDVDPVELPAHASAVTRHTPVTGADQKVLVTPLQGHPNGQQISSSGSAAQPPTQYYQHPGPQNFNPASVSEPPASSAPASQPTAGRYQPYNPGRHIPTPEESKRNSVSGSFYHVPGHVEAEQTTWDKRYSMAGPTPPRVLPEDVPAILQPPRVPPKQPLDHDASASTSLDQEPRRIPTILKPGGGRIGITRPPLRDHRAHSTPDYQPYNPYRDLTEHIDDTARLYSKSTQPLGPTTRPVSTGPDHPKPEHHPVGGKPTVNRANTLPSDMPALPYLGMDNSNKTSRLQSVPEPLHQPAVKVTISGQESTTAVFHDYSSPTIQAPDFPQPFKNSSSYSTSQQGQYGTAGPSYETVSHQPSSGLESQAFTSVVPQPHDPGHGGGGYGERLAGKTVTTGGNSAVSPAGSQTGSANDSHGHGFIVVSDPYPQPETQPRRGSEPPHDSFSRSSHDGVFRPLSVQQHRPADTVSVYPNSERRPSSPRQYGGGPVPPHIDRGTAPQSPNRGARNPGPTAAAARRVSLSNPSHGFIVDSSSGPPPSVSEQPTPKPSGTNMRSTVAHSQPHGYQNYAQGHHGSHQPNARANPDATRPRPMSMQFPLYPSSANAMQQGQPHSAQFQQFLPTHSHHSFYQSEHPFRPEMFGSTPKYPAGQGGMSIRLPNTPPSPTQAISANSSLTKSRHSSTSEQGGSGPTTRIPLIAGPSQDASRVPYSRAIAVDRSERIPTPQPVPLPAPPIPQQTPSGGSRSSSQATLIPQPVPVPQPPSTASDGGLSQSSLVPSQAPPRPEKRPIFQAQPMVATHKSPPPQSVSLHTSQISAASPQSPNASNPQPGPPVRQQGTALPSSPNRGISVEPGYPTVQTAHSAPQQPLPPPSQARTPRGSTAQPSAATGAPGSVATSSVVPAPPHMQATKQEHTITHDPVSQRPRVGSVASQTSQQSTTSAQQTQMQTTPNMPQQPGFVLQHGMASHVPGGAQVAMYNLPQQAAGFPVQHSVSYTHGGMQQVFIPQPEQHNLVGLTLQPSSGSTPVQQAQPGSPSLTSPQKTKERWFGKVFRSGSTKKQNPAAEGAAAAQTGPAQGGSNPVDHTQPVGSVHNQQMPAQVIPLQQQDYSPGQQRFVQAAVEIASWASPQSGDAFQGVYYLPQQMAFQGQPQSFSHGPQVGGQFVEYAAPNQPPQGQMVQEQHPQQQHPQQQHPQQQQQQYQQQQQGSFNVQYGQPSQHSYHPQTGYQQQPAHQSQAGPEKTSHPTSESRSTSIASVPESVTGQSRVDSNDAAANQYKGPVAHVQPGSPPALAKEVSNNSRQNPSVLTSSQGGPVETHPPSSAAGVSCAKGQQEHRHDAEKKEQTDQVGVLLSTAATRNSVSNASSCIKTPSRADSLMADSAFTTTAASRHSSGNVIITAPPPPPAPSAAGAGNNTVATPGSSHDGCHPNLPLVVTTTTASSSRPNRVDIPSTMTTRAATASTKILTTTTTSSTPRANDSWKLTPSTKTGGGVERNNTQKSGISDVSVAPVTDSSTFAAVVSDDDDDDDDDGNGYDDMVVVETGGGGGKQGQQHSALSVPHTAPAPASTPISAASKWGDSSGYDGSGWGDDDDDEYGDPGYGYGGYGGGY